MKNKKVERSLEKLYSVDHSQSWHKTKSVFQSELSFTILAWKQLEKLIATDNYDLDDIEYYQRVRLLFCIFPKSQTVMHKLCGNKDKSAMQQVAQYVD